MENAVKRILVILLGCIVWMCGSDCWATPSCGTVQEKDEIPVEGEWKERQRSVSDDVLVTVFWDGTYLYIESTTGRSEIQVSLSNGFQATIPMGTTSTAIYVGELDGSCELDLTNQFGDRLVGTID